MSGILEQLLAAVTRNNELLEGAAEGREKVLAAAEAASTKAAGTKGTKAASAKTEEKPADKPAATKTEDADVPSVDDVNAAIKKYVGGTDRKEERSARSTKVKGVLTKFSPEGTETVNGGTLLAEKRAAFIKTVEKWIADGDLTQPEPAASDDDDLLDD